MSPFTVAREYPHNVTQFCNNLYFLSHLQHLLHLPAHHKSVKPSSGLVQTLCNELCRETFLKLLTALCVISSIGDKNLGVSLESSDAKERKVDDGLKTDQKHVPRVMVLICFDARKSSLPSKG